MGIKAFNHGDDFVNKLVRAIASDSTGLDATSPVPVVGEGMTATGGAVSDWTDSGPGSVYRSHVFTSTGTFVVSDATSDFGSTVDYLVVAGGGGGGAQTAGSFYSGAGGGGAGGLKTSIPGVMPNTGSALPVAAASYTVTIGAGGRYAYPGSEKGSNGVNSSLQYNGGTITCTGGGGGGSTLAPGNSDFPTNRFGAPGGSGGGAGGNNPPGDDTQGNASPNTDPDRQGYPGTDIGANNGAGGGGGGAGQIGQNHVGQTRGGHGGSGSLSNITGTDTFYAGGGGGHTDRSGNASIRALGGPGGGGDGGIYNNPNRSAVAGGTNTGGGGGSATGTGVGYDSFSAAGGSGIVIVSYDSGSFNGAGGIVGPGSGSRKSHSFLSTDTFKIGATTDFQIVTDSLQVHLDAGNFSSRGDSTWTDLTGNGHNATLTNGPVLNNFYYEFDGSNDSARFAQSSDMVSTTNMSIEMWLAVGSIGSKYTAFIINRSTTAGDNSTTMQIGIDNRQVVRTWNSSGNDTMVLFVQVANNAGNASYYAWSKEKFGTSNGDGNFHHVVGTFSDGYLKLYYDGSLVYTNSSAPSSIWAGDSYFRIAGEYSPGGTTYNLLGNVAQVRFYKKTLSDAEILQNYNATKTNFV